MKETKVWIDGEFPQVYFDPKTRNESIEGRPLILEDIKTHDRELVKEVCEKIRTIAHKVGKLVFCEHCYKTNSARAIDEHLLNEILGQIESEFEQKEFEK